MVRPIVAALCAAALAGCAASRQDVAKRLDNDFVGQRIDAMVARFGPPSKSFRLDSGDTSYQWQLSTVTDIATERGYGQAHTRHCRVTVMASPEGIVRQLSTEDSNAGGGIVGALGGYGSICAQRLGMERQG